MVATLEQKSKPRLAIAAETGSATQDFNDMLSREGLGINYSPDAVIGDSLKTLATNYGEFTNPRHTAALDNIAGVLEQLLDDGMLRLPGGELKADEQEKAISQLFVTYAQRGGPTSADERGALNRVATAFLNFQESVRESRDQLVMPPLTNQDRLYAKAITTGDLTGMGTIIDQIGRGRLDPTDPLGAFNGQPVQGVTESYALYA